MIIDPCYAVNYSDAISHARQAFIIQSGIQNDLNKLGDYGKSELQYLGLENELGASVFVYKTYRDRACSIPLGSGKKLILNFNSMTLILPINWR